MFESSEKKLTREELAWELVELFDELSTEQINEVLAKNVPLESLEFFTAYADHFASNLDLEDRARKQMPNLLLLGYLLRVLEDRLITEPETFDA